MPPDAGTELSVAACNELIEGARHAATVEELHALCARLSERAGFDYFLYGAILPVSLARPQTVVVSGYPTDWWAHYQAQGYMRIDPVVQHTLGHYTLPLDWHEISPESYAASDQVRRFLSEAGDFGLVSGVSFPVQGPNGECALLSLATSDTHTKARGRIAEAMPFTQLLAGYIHEAGRRIFSDKVVTLRRTVLTQREKDCLLWAAEGKTSAETAMILNISERTVLFHLQNAATKLDVSNRAQAVARAVVLGYITPQFQ